MRLQSVRKSWDLDFHYQDLNQQVASRKELPSGPSGTGSSTDHQSTEVHAWTKTCEAIPSELVSKELGDYYS
jgi:hypothetical protein